MPPASAQAIIAKLAEHAFQAFYVGGCVRDLALKLEPSDWDISTDATPQQLLQLFPRAQLVGAKFGVVLVDSVEVATFRSDFAYRDGRHPEGVRYETDPKQDVLRRDFTINALLMDPATQRIVDYTGGLDDLRAGVIRAIGDPVQRLQEDHLRMLRAVRFAARFGFTIEDATMAAIRKLHADILRISPERVRDELIRILTEGGARRGFELLDETGLLADILPEVAAFHGVEQPPQYHPEGDVWVHTLMMLERMQSPSPELAMGVLLHDAGKPGTFRVADRIRFDGHVELGEEIARRILNRLHFSNQQIDQILALVGNHMRFMDAHRMRESTLKRFLRLPRFEEHLELHRLDSTCSSGNLESYHFAKSRFEQAPAEELRPVRLIKGNDLIAAGYQPGPEFSKVLDAVEDAQLEGRIHTREEAMELVKELLGEHHVE